MWRYLAGGGAGLAAIGAVAVIWSGNGAASKTGLPSAPVQAGAPANDASLPDRVPEASARTRQEKRFGRYDKDRDGGITREEYLAARRKAYAKLDVDGDGRLSFDEWAAKAAGRFAKADQDRSGVMDPAEFATTAVKRKPARRCAPASPSSEGDGEG